MIDLDRYSRLDSPIHRLEPRSRLVGFGALIAGFALVRDPVLLAPMLVIAAAAVERAGHANHQDLATGFAEHRAALDRRAEKGDCRLPHSKRKKTDSGTTRVADQFRQRVGDRLLPWQRRRDLRRKLSHAAAGRIHAGVMPRLGTGRGSR